LFWLVHFISGCSVENGKDIDLPGAGNLLDEVLVAKAMGINARYSYD